MMSQVQDLLASFSAHATFFLISDYIAGHEDSLVAMLQAGHEVANHGCSDRSYAQYSEQNFETALLEAERCCCMLRHKAALQLPPKRWFRAPHGRLSGTMQRVLHRHGFTNVICDGYANDPWISDADFIVEHTLSQVTDGSIIVIHMPEHGFRDHNLGAMHGILMGLRQRGLVPVTMTELDALASRWDLPLNGS